MCTGQQIMEAHADLPGADDARVAGEALVEHRQVRQLILLPVAAAARADPRRRGHQLHDVVAPAKVLAGPAGRVTASFCQERKDCYTVASVGATESACVAADGEARCMSLSSEHRDPSRSYDLGRGGWGSFRWRCCHGCQRYRSRIRHR